VSTNDPGTCDEVEFLTSEALKTLQFESPVNVSNVGFSLCFCGHITLTDARGDFEYFTFTLDPGGKTSSPTLHDDPIGPDVAAKGDEALVDASLVLMGDWVARSFTLDEIALFATTNGPPYCWANQPEMRARSILALANQPRYSRIVVPVACVDESIQAATLDVPTESKRIQVVNLADAQKQHQPRPAGMLLQQGGIDPNGTE
jgi:hypothetical protein